MDRAADLRADYDRLGVLIGSEEDGSKAAALARERRLLGELLEQIEKPVEVPFVDELASRRQPGPGDSGSSSRRRKPG